MKTNKTMRQNKTFQIIISVLIAFFVWLFAFYNEPNITKSFKDLTINMDNASDIGLEVVEVSDVKARVVIEGKKYEIGNYKSDDVRVYPDFSNVSSEGTYEVPLVVQNNGSAFSVSSINPTTIVVRLENRTEKQLKINYNIIGLSVPEGYELQSNNIVLEPSYVTISGAVSMISQIESARVDVNVNATLSMSKDYSNFVEYFDENGAKLDFVGVQGFHSSDDIIKVHVPVKQIKTVPLELSFVNVPTTFDLNSLPYTMSETEICIDGEKNTIQKIEKYIIGYIDFNQFDPISKPDYQFEISLPQDVRNRDVYDSVSVLFKSDYFSSTMVPLDIEHVTVKNAPFGLNTELTEKVIKVKVVGEKSAIKNITKQNIYAEIDLTSKGAGDYQAPLTLYSDYNQTWIFGEYFMDVSIK